MLTSKPKNRSVGFSLVEVMVGLVIGMLGILVIMQVFAVSEGQKRTTTSGGDAQASALAAISAIQRDLQQAGFGYTWIPGATTNPFFACSVRAVNGNFRLYPVLITEGAGGLSDTVTIAYGESTGTNAPLVLTTTQAVATDPYALRAVRGIYYGDLVLMAEPGKACTLAQATDAAGGGTLPPPAVPALGTPFPAGTMLLPHVIGASPYNFNSGVSYCTPGPPCNAFLVNLGATPFVQTYWVTLNNAVVPTNTFALSDVLQNPIPGVGNTLALADNIVSLQAQYGIDTDNDNALDFWTDATGAYANTVTTPAAVAVSTIKAVRIAIVARSSLQERPIPPATTCNITTVAPTVWGSSPPSVTLDLTANPNWQCHRYQVYETTIPLRNMIWRETL